MVECNRRTVCRKIHLTHGYRYVLPHESDISKFIPGGIIDLKGNLVRRAIGKDPVFC
jgi:hypothetical protein